MTALLTQVAEAAGVAPRWRDTFGVWHDVAPDTLRAVLTALELPAHSEADIAESHAILEARSRMLPPLVTATVNDAMRLPVGGRFTVTLDDGTRREGIAEDGMLPGIDRAGYHSLEIDGRRVVLAVAPRRGYTIEDGALAMAAWAISAPCRTWWAQPRGWALRASRSARCTRSSRRTRTGSAPIRHRAAYN